MKKKTIGIGILIGVLLIGIVSAGLVGYLSNMVTATVEVKEPVFYASPIEIPGSVNARELWINKIPNESSTNFTDGDFRAFETIALGITKLYPVNYSFYIRTHINNISFSQKLELELYIYDTNTGEIKEDDILCREYITINSEEYEDYSILCEGNELYLNPQDGLYWKMTGFNTNENVRFYIKLGEMTRIEVSAT